MTKKYHIYQLDASNPNVIANRKMFLNWRLLENCGGGFDIKDYKKVYDGETDEKGNDKEILETLFEEFNLRHPEDFHGHSLSVSDVVVLNGTMYFCDSFDWKKI